MQAILKARQQTNTRSRKATFHSSRSHPNEVGVGFQCLRQSTGKRKNKSNRRTKTKNQTRWTWAHCWTISSQTTSTDWFRGTMLAWQLTPAWSKLAYSYQTSKNPARAKDSWFHLCPRFKSKPLAETTSRSLTKSQWCSMTRAMTDSCCSPVSSFKEVSLNKRKRKIRMTKTH